MDPCTIFKASTGYEGVVDSAKLDISLPRASFSGLISSQISYQDSEEESRQQSLHFETRSESGCLVSREPFAGHQIIMAYSPENATCAILTSLRSDLVRKLNAKGTTFWEPLLSDVVEAFTTSSTANALKHVRCETKGGPRLYVGLAPSCQVQINGKAAGVLDVKTFVNGVWKALIKIRGKSEEALIAVRYRHTHTHDVCCRYSFRCG